MRKFVSVLLTLILAMLCLNGCTEKHMTLGWTDGTIADGVYTNDALQMHFQIPDAWLEATEEETRSILGADPNDTATIYDVLLGPSGGMEKMYVVCMDLSKTIGGSKLTPKDALQSMIDESDASALLSGASYGKICDRTVCGLTYASVDLVTADGIYQRIMMHKLSEKQIVMLGVVATSQTDLDYYFAHFTDDPATLPSPAVLESAKPFSRGVITGNAYVSSYLGLRFTAPEDWSYATDEELSELMGISMDIIGEDVYGDNKEQAEELAKQAVIYDMIAAAPNGSNVQIVLENLEVSTGSADLTEAEYAEILRTQLASITDLSYEVSDSYTDTLAGLSFTVVDATVKENALTQRFWLRRVDNYILHLTFSGLQEDVESFSALFAAA